MIVDRFFVWVRKATAEQRLRIVAPMVRAHAEAASSEDERETLDAALTVLAADPEPAVRAALAAELCTSPTPPRHLLLDLVWDMPEIAAVLAARCDDLIEAELIDLAAGAHDTVRRALAGRRRIGPGLSAALAETVDREGAVVLAANPGADLSAATLLRLVDRFGEYADLRDAVASRDRVPITVRHRMLEKLAEAIGNLVVLDRSGGIGRAEALTRDARDRATVQLSATANDAELTVLVDHLRRTGQLTTRLVLRAVCVGDLRFVEEAIAVLADVPLRRVAALVADGRESAFRALYRKARMPERAYPAFAAALEIHRELVAETGGLDGRAGDRARFSRRLVERVLSRLAVPGERDADDLMVLLRRFSADAAREQARALVAERSRTVTPALAAPVVETVEAEAEPAVDEIRIDPARDRITAEAVVRDTVPDVVAPTSEPAPAWALDAEEAVAPVVPDELDEPVGLFSHVDLADVPEEWLHEEPAPVPENIAFDFTDYLRGSIAA